MELKEFLQSRFDKSHFIEFISDRFYGFSQNLIDDKYLGKVKLDDKSEIGFFIFKENENKDIENSRVGFHNELKKYADEHLLDGAIGAFYNLTCNAWRLSFIRFSYDDNNKKVFTNQKRFTFVLGNNKTKTAYEQLKNVKYPKILELEKAFSIEAVTKDFYKGLVKEYEKLLNEYLVYPLTKDSSKKEFAIRLLGRILFIKFLNKKSLVPDSIFEVSNGYYHEKLEPLFFEQLNTPKSERKEEFSNDSIPFLNGGLFEPLKDLDCYEWNGVCSSYINTLKIDDRFFTELYEHLNQYNFTIDENSIEDSDLSIDPEMLGRIFENLLAEINPETSQNARKSTGSYYTPREIVEYMVSSSLLEYLKTKTFIDEETLKTIIFKNEEPKNDYDKAKVLSAIFELKILDPACGSGAFPMGLLQKIVKILNLIDEDASIWFGLQNKEFREVHKNRNKDYIRKLSIIKNTIYGIDIQPIAIEISKLRFFLSLIVDEDGEPEPLPNLEFKFVCANSLLPKPKNTQLASIEYFMLESDLLRLKNEYFEASGERKREIKKEYTETQKKMFEEEEATNLLSALENKLTDYNPFDPLSVAGFFDSDFMFNIKDGFDIVIGNPPYISALTDSKNEFSVKLREELKKHYTQLSGQFDLYVPFLLNSINLLNKNGIFSWIIPNKFLVAKYAQKSYNFLANNGLFQIISCSHLNVFENASVYPIILLGSRGQSRKIFKYKAEFFKSFLNQDFLVESKQEANNSILIKDTELKLSSGMTGFMAQSIIPLINSENFSESNIPFIVSGNIDRYVMDSNTVKYMKSTYKNPKILLDNNIISEGKIELWLKPKIIIAGMTKVIEAIYVENPIAIGVGVYAINNFSNYLPKFLVAVLNSKFLTYYLQTNFKEKHLAGGYLAINKNTIEQLPLPNIFDEQQKIFEFLVDYVTFLKALPSEQKIDEYVSNEHIVKQFEEVIDGMVFELYFTDEFKAKNIEFIKYAKEDFRSIENLDNVSKQKVIKEAYLKLSETKNPIRNNLMLLPIEFEFIKMILWS